MYLQAASLQPTMQELLVHHSGCNPLLRGCHARLCVIGCFSLSLNRPTVQNLSLAAFPDRLGAMEIREAVFFATTRSRRWVAISGRRS
jgi:hypothetical protein